MSATKPNISNAPRAASKDTTVDIGPRPHTVEPSRLAVVEIHSGEIESMDNQQLATWLLYNTGKWIDPSYNRSRFLTEFFREAESVIK